MADWARTALFTLPSSEPGTRAPLLPLLCRTTNSEVCRSESPASSPVLACSSRICSTIVTSASGKGPRPLLPPQLLLLLLILPLLLPMPMTVLMGCIEASSEEGRATATAGRGEAADC